MVLALSAAEAGKARFDVEDAQVQAAGAAIGRETDGKRFYLSAEDLAKIPPSACGDGGGIGDPRLKKPVAGELANDVDIKVSWGQVKKH